MDLVIYSQTVNKANINLQKNVSFNRIKYFFILLLIRICNRIEKNDICIFLKVYMHYLYIKYDIKYVPKYIFGKTTLRKIAFSIFP